MHTLKKYLIKVPFVINLVHWSKTKVLPGFDGIPIYYVATFFIQELQKENLNTKATSLAFRFLLALFPGIIFLFTLIPYIPIQDFQDQLLVLLSEFLPRNVQDAMETTILEIVKKQNGGLLSIGFFTAIFFSTNGIVALMNSFNKSALVKESRGFFKQRGIAIMLTFLISMLLLLAIVVITVGEYIIDLLHDEKIIEGDFIYWLLLGSRWGVIIGLFFIAISALYYFGPNNREKFRFISAGSTLTTILIILTSIVFAYYINNFGRYNKIYGSIGTLIVVMLWLYFNSLILLIGYELNASIYITQKNIHLLTKPARKNMLHREAL